MAKVDFVVEMNAAIDRETERQCQNFLGGAPEYNHRTGQQLETDRVPVPPEVFEAKRPEVIKAVIKVIMREVE